MLTNHFIAIASILFAGTLANTNKATIAYRDSAAGTHEIRNKQTGMHLKTIVFCVVALIIFALYSLFAGWGKPFEMANSPFAILFLISQPAFWLLTAKASPKPDQDTEPKQGAYYRVALQAWFQPMQDFVTGQYLTTVGLLLCVLSEIHMDSARPPIALMLLALGPLLFVFSYLRLHKKLVRTLIAASIGLPILIIELSR